VLHHLVLVSPCRLGRINLRFLGLDGVAVLVLHELRPVAVRLVGLVHGNEGRHRVPAHQAVTLLLLVREVLRKDA